MRISLQRLRIVVGGVLLLSVVLLVGCGGGGAASKDLLLSGKVTYNGTPVTGGSLTLTPTDKSTPPVNTQIQGDGKYSIVPPGLGEMKVGIETESISKMTGGGVAYPGAPKEARQPKMDPAHFQKYVKIPSKYKDASSSGLTVTIKSENGGKNVKDFELTD